MPGPFEPVAEVCPECPKSTRRQLLANAVMTASRKNDVCGGYGDLKIRKLLLKVL
jgi:hypothetical protein